MLIEGAALSGEEGILLSRTHYVISQRRPLARMTVGYSQPVHLVGTKPQPVQPGSPRRCRTTRFAATRFVGPQDYSKRRRKPQPTSATAPRSANADGSGTPRCCCSNVKRVTSPLVSVLPVTLGPP